MTEDAFSRDVSCIKFLVLGTKVADLVDIEYHNRYHAEKEKSGISSSVDTFEVLDNTTVLSAHDDYILRVFNLTTGTDEHK